MTILLLFATFPHRDEAEKVTKALLRQRLISCVNLSSVESAYWWKENIKQRKEILALMKSRPEFKERLRKEIERLHSYEVPSIESIEVEANDAYARWVFGETEPR